LEISAKEIEKWAGGKAAQAELPRYVRRLIHNVGSITQISVPAGDSTNQPGWDGELTSESGNAWVPAGKSFWEMSCEAQIPQIARRELLMQSSMRRDAPNVWPIGPVRDLLNRPEMEGMRAAFAMGARNKRGMTTRTLDEGGRQERHLAATYRSHALALHNSHLNVAAILDELASGYEGDGFREDIRAKLGREGY
jgi:hypothetical protein